MNKVVNTLRDSIIDYCESIGNDPMYVQGAGGNVSWKDDGVLWIKASGTWLSDAHLKDIFVPVDLDALQSAIKEEDFTITPTVITETPLRPSIETLLHALMPHRVVVHVHAIDPLAYLVRDNSELEISKKIKSTLSWAIVDYQKPGAALAKAVANAMVEKADTNILLLQNHGVVIGGSDIEEVNDILMLLSSALRINPYSNKINPKMPEPIVLNNELQYVPIGILELHNLALPPLYNRLNTDWALFPDHVVFLGSQAHCYNSIERLKEDIEFDSAPELIFLKGVGVFTKPEFSIAKKTQLQCFYDILIRQSENLSLRVLNEQQIGELLDWDAERYRQNIEKI